MDKLKIIKIVVFIMTFLLVFGTLYALGLLYKQTSHISSPAQASTVNLNQTKGSYIAALSSNDNELYLLIKGGGLSDRIITFDTKNQSIISTLTLN